MPDYMKLVIYGGAFMFLVGAIYFTRRAFEIAEEESRRPTLLELSLGIYTAFLSLAIFLPQFLQDVVDWDYSRVKRLQEIMILPLSVIFWGVVFWFSRVIREEDNNSTPPKTEVPPQTPD